MIQTSAYKAPPHILECLSYLLNLLRIEKEKYDRIAFSVTDRQIKYAVSSLAQESNQYICELVSQLSSLGADTLAEQDEKMSIEYPDAEMNAAPDKILNVGTMEFFRESEKQMIKAYRAVLNEPFLMEGVRMLIRSQLNGMMYAFLQLKLFGTAG
ncbi:hypothetical protein [Agriterribacter sp.]|uniref:hypothetical protein n=1 Tax=Agriterribacter sp. TaxID=2821509 RepID=UPI002B827AEF|nr:hypothetical protein [Agriterribacter sp.]HRP55568.1 hypothetical protein [Agriterribacter sp.]